MPGGKKKTTASATMWCFDANDPIVAAYLPAEMMRATRVWQPSAEYRFEFHEGHTTGGGKPLYIRPRSLDDSRDGNIPKLNTKGPAPVAFTSINNSESLGSLDQTTRTELFNFIVTNWGALQTIAHNYWEGTPVPAPAQVRPELYCTCGATIAGNVDVGQPNAHGKYKCPKCQKFNAK